MPADPTPERIVHDLFPTVLSPRTGEWEVRRPSAGDVLEALRAYGDARAAAERERAAAWIQLRLMPADQRAISWHEVADTLALIHRGEPVPEPERKRGLPRRKPKE